ncbi:N-acetylglutaminylglutamine synthetase [uncultured Abyssibacter sp.]|uniref:N-acetylglutaminylglutamine synthetase n=1 Tax=uncultured Abyssibacter sp. TaxID=2320202 RepID=UPI0032B1FBB4
MSERKRVDHRFDRSRAPSLQWGGQRRGPDGEVPPAGVILNCGWGRLIFAHTFSELESVAQALREERTGQRDIAFYIRDPHVVLAYAPQELFLDPSHTFRLWLNHVPRQPSSPRGFTVRQMTTSADAEGILRLYKLRHMVPTPPDFLWDNRKNRRLVYLVAEEAGTGRIIGTATGVDHAESFDDPENGSSLWCLAVDPECQVPGVGQAIVLQLAETFLARGRAYMDLSVLHDNAQAIALYEKLGFQRVPVFTVKRKNPINHKLFIGPDEEQRLNPYATIITTEAKRRGIQVKVLDADEAYFSLSHGGRRIVCRESLCDLTSAIAMSRCDNKRVTSRLLRKAGLQVPVQQVAGDPAENAAFLAEHGSVVVKPARGEQGAGIAVDVRTPKVLRTSVKEARKVCETVLLESFHQGDDLRIIVIDHRVVAAALRKPPVVRGTGRHTVQQLIEKLSRRREAATEGESRIPMDAETQRCIEHAGLTMESVLAEGELLPVRKTANLHTGGTLHDVTDQLSAHLRDVAITASRALEIPVVGLDLLIDRPEGEDYVIIEANERPGLANHEPQPTAQRFVDLLFPETAESARHLHAHQA